MTDMSKLNQEIEGMFNEGHTYEDIINQVMEDHDVELDVASRWVASVEEELTMAEERSYYDVDTDELEISPQSGIDIVEGVEYDMDFNYE